MELFYPYLLLTHSLGMTRAEMTLKVVMSLSEPVDAFVEQFNKLLADADVHEFGKVLEMKGIRKVDQTAFIDCFNSLNKSEDVISPAKAADPASGGHVGGSESGIKKLEKMIKKTVTSGKF